jgi:hypothetical protein
VLPSCRPLSQIGAAAIHHPDHDDFLAAIDRFETVALTFTANEDGGAELSRTCAPLDYGPRPRVPDCSDCYHLWDYDSDSPEGPHVLSLLPVQVLRIQPTGDTFDPGEFIVWPTDWHHPRDWGAYS